METNSQFFAPGLGPSQVHICRIFSKTLLPLHFLFAGENIKLQSPINMPCKCCDGILPNGLDGTVQLTSGGGAAVKMAMEAAPTRACASESTHGTEGAWEGAAEWLWLPDVDRARFEAVPWSRSGAAAGGGMAAGSPELLDAQKGGLPMCIANPARKGVLLLDAPALSPGCAQPHPTFLGTGGVLLRLGGALDDDEAAAFDDCAGGTRQSFVVARVDDLWFVHCGYAGCVV